MRKFAMAALGCAALICSTPAEAQTRAEPPEGMTRYATEGRYAIDVRSGEYCTLSSHEGAYHFFMTRSGRSTVFGFAVAGEGTIKMPVGERDLALYMFYNEELAPTDGERVISTYTINRVEGYNSKVALTLFGEDGGNGEFLQLAMSKRIGVFRTDGREEIVFSWDTSDILPAITKLEECRDAQTGK